jgi:hypothetical protein
MHFVIPRAQNMVMHMPLSPRDRMHNCGLIVRNEACPTPKISARLDFPIKCPAYEGALTVTARAGGVVGLLSETLDVRNESVRML